MSGDDEKQEIARRPLIEWVAGGIGLVLTLWLVAFIGWQALAESETAPPRIAVQVTSVTHGQGGYLVEIKAENLAPQTAAGVEVEGEVTGGDGIVETSSTTFDYIPGHSEARGGLFFTTNPAAGEFAVRALGYKVP